MDETIITRTIKTTLFGGALLFPFIAQKMELAVAWGFLAGLFISLTNLHLLSLLAKNLFITSPQRGILFSLAVLKFPLFYGGLVSFLYFSREVISMNALMVGFSFPLLVIVLKKVGPMLIHEMAQSDGKRTRHAHAA